MHIKRRVKRKVADDAEKIQSAILSLEARLEQTQEGMARLLGCTLGAYSKWHRGETVPGGQWLLKLLRLCPDEQTRAAFGLRPESTDQKSSAPCNVGRVPPMATGKPVRELSPEEKYNILLQYNDAHEGLDLACELAQLGHPGAAQVLADCADKLSRRSGDWRRKKYSKPK